MAKSDITPKHDSSLGLVFRLNGLWAEVDAPAKTGNYEQWNNVLDRIYCNLLYRENMEIIKDEKTEEILDIKLKGKDDEEYRFLSSRVNKFRRLFNSVSGKTSKGISRKRIARTKWYQSLLIKDIWLRKFMFKLNLYLKETVKTPGSAMFGGG